MVFYIGSTHHLLGHLFVQKPIRCLLPRSPKSVLVGNVAPLFYEPTSTAMAREIRSSCLTALDSFVVAST